MKRQNSKSFISILSALLILLILVIGGRGNSSAFAETAETKYTDVLTDLQKDDNFNVEDYPEIEDDYSLQIIQIAESVNGELFVYVYNPCGNTKPLPATKVNMSLAESVDETRLYTLTLLSQNGVFQKLKVDNLEVSNDSVRYYNISTVYRLYDENLDTGSTSESTITEKAFPVGKLYVVSKEGGEVLYRERKTDIVDIDDLYFDFFRYQTYYNGFFVSSTENVDSHYVAFSTEIPIDTIYNARVSFSYCTRRGRCGFSGKHFFGKYDYMKYADGGGSEKIVNLSDCDSVSITKKDLFDRKSYHWNRIERVEAILSDSDIVLTEEAQRGLAGKQWVLRFYESNFEEVASNQSHYVNSTFVSDVAILRLFYEYDEDLYDVGVVSDIGHGDDIAGNIKPKTTVSLWEMFIDFCKFLEKCTGISYIFWAFLFIAVPVLILLGVLSIFVSPLRLIFKGIWWVICLPFKGIKRLIEWIQDKKGGG